MRRSTCAKLISLIPTFFAVNAFAAPAVTRDGNPAPCAIVLAHAGSVQILDSSRGNPIEADKDSHVACDSWVSITNGWAKLKHRDGFEIGLGAQTFAQFPESNRDGRNTGDAVVLLRGEAYGTTGGGSGELRVITANGRVRATRGSVLVVYESESDETQLVALDYHASLENRFQAQRRVKVGAGEASSLNFKLLRVVPSAPKAVAVSSLRPRLQRMSFPEHHQKTVVTRAAQRAERAFATKFDVERESAPHPEFNRAPASITPIVAAEIVPDSLNEPKPEHPVLSSHIVRRLAGGDRSAEQMIYPEKYQGKAQRFNIEVIDPAAKMLKQQKKEEENEKRRLIEELSQIRVE